MRYAIYPMQPTPNGRMHIGHGGGTYLRADVLKRSLQAEGHEVVMPCGSDAYENWVLAAAAMEGRAPEGICRTYHEAILADLTWLGIDLDAWIDPLSDPHREPYLELHTEMFRTVVDAGAAHTEVEAIPYDSDGSPLMGTFIAGNCPNCEAPAGGSSCTACGEHFQPFQLLSPRARLSGSPIVWRREEHWFLRPRSRPELLASLSETGLGQAHLDVAARYLTRSGGRVRLSGPGTWGVSSSALPKEQVLANSYYLYCLYAGRASGGATDPFAAQSETVNVGVFGSDNSTPGLIVPGVYAQATSGQLKAFDHAIVNGMLDLDGEKCSTSKGHGIWLGDLRTAGTVTADELRFALAGVDVDTGRANLDLPDLAADVNYLRRVMRERVLPLARACHHAGVAVADPGTVAAQRRHLQPVSLHLPRAREAVISHLGSDASDGPRWLATLVELIRPLTPGIAAALASCMGRLSSPRDSAPVIEDVVRPGELPLSDLEAVVRRGSPAA